MVERGGHEELNFEAWKRMFEINVDGHFLSACGGRGLIPGPA